MADPESRNDVDEALALARRLYPDQSVNAAPTSISEDVGRRAGQAMAAAPDWLSAGADPNKIESAVRTAMQVLPPFAIEQGATEAERGNYGTAAIDIGSALPVGKAMAVAGKYAAAPILKAMSAIGPKLEKAENVFKSIPEAERERQARAMMQGYNVDAWHGSPRNIGRFKNDFSSNEGHYGSNHYFSNSVDDINHNYATPEGADLVNRTQRESESLSDIEDYQLREALDELGIEHSDEDLSDDHIEKAIQKIVRDSLGIENEGAVYPVKLRMQNPVRVGGKGETVFDWHEPYNEAADEYGEPTGSAVKLIEALKNNAQWYGADPGEVEDAIQSIASDAAYNGGISASDFERHVRNMNIYNDVDGNSASPGALIADVYRDLGHDSIDMDAYSNFGPRKVGMGINVVGMQGLTPETRHYIKLDNKGIRSRFAKFDPENIDSPDIDKNRGGYIHKEGGGAATADDYRASPYQQEIDAAMAVAQQAHQLQEPPVKTAEGPQYNPDRVSYTIPGVGQFTDTQGNLDKRARMRDYAMNESWPAQALKAAGQAVTFPGRYATGQVPEDQAIPEALNLAMTFTGGAGALPAAAEGTELRAGAGLYSKAERAAQAIQQNKMTTEQAAAMLAKAGVSPEEMKWTGLSEALAKPGALTKDELVNMIRQGDVELNEITKGSQSKYPYSTFNEWNDAYMGAEQRGDFDEAHNIMTAWEAYDGMGGADSPKYRKYALTGGKNYQETLLTLPNPAEKLNQRRLEIEKLGKSSTEEQRQEWADIMNKIRPLSEDREGGQRFKNFPDFQSSHWPDAPNVLAHIRTNEFNSPQGKIFNLDELQSDWAQKGRSGGFRKTLTSLPEGYTVTEVPYRDTVRYEVHDENGMLQGGGYNRETAINSTINNLNDAGVPVAPYVQSTKEWTDLGLKKALQKAVDSDADYFTWTPGEVQAERYDLSKQVRKIHFLPNDDGTWHVGTELPDGSEFFSASGIMDLAKIKKNFGKEIAEKVEKGEFSGTDNNVAYLEGEDLRVGGKGMEDYYGNVVPKRLQEVVRKVTGQKIQFEPVTIPSGDGVQAMGFRLTPEIKQAIREKGLSHFASGGAVKKAMQIASGHDTQSIRCDKSGGIKNGRKHDQHGNVKRLGGEVTFSGIHHSLSRCAEGD